MYNPDSGRCARNNTKRRGEEAEGTTTVSIELLRLVGSDLKALLTQTRHFDRPVSNGMAALSREDTTPQSVIDADCSSAVQ